MFDKLLKTVFNKEEAVKETIQSALSSVAKETRAKHGRFFIAIKPSDDSFNFDCFIYKVPEHVEKPKGIADYQFVRKISLDEILNGKEESREHGSE